MQTTTTERQIAIIRDVVVTRDSRKRFDLFITDRRIAVIFVGNKSGGFYGGGLVGGLLGEFVIKRAANADLKDTEENMKNYSLDQLLAMEKKRNCFYSYDEIKEIKLYPVKKGFKFIIQNKECEGEFSPSQEQYEQLCGLLPSIDGLSGKIKCNT